MTTTVEPLTPSDEELSHMTKTQLTAVIESYGVRPSSKTDKPGLLKTARAFVHEARAEVRDAVEAAQQVEPAVAAPAVDEDAAGVSVALEPAPLHVVPEYSRFQVIQQVAAVLTKSNLTPDTIRGKLPDVTHILLKANDVGIPLTTALEQVYVVHGKTGMESKLMRALIRRDGHTLAQPKRDEPGGRDDGFCSIVSGRRCDTGEEGEAEFTLDDAIEQELIAGYDAHDDGTYTVRPVNGKPMWKKDTKNMLTERATARLARWLFSECLGGITYTPDELGYIEVEGEEVEKPRYGRAGEAEPTMTHRQMVASLAERIADLPDDVRRELAQKWSAANYPRVDDLRPPQVPTATRWVEAAEATVAERDSTEHIPDADEVTDQNEGQPDPARSGEDGVEGSAAADRDAPEPSPAEDRQEAGEPGLPAGDDGEAHSPAPVAASPAPDEPPLTVEDVGPLCVGCHEEIAGAAVETDDGWYHADCAPYGEPGETLL